MGPCGVGSGVGYLNWGSKGMQRQGCVHARLLVVSKKKKLMKQLNTNN